MAAESGYSKREFLIASLRLSGQIALGTAGIYSASLISGNGKFGGLTAGAKCSDICGGDVPIGTVMEGCLIFPGGPQNIKQKYECKSFGWQQKNPSPTVIGFCPDFC